MNIDGLITPDELPVIERVFNEIKDEFPVVEAFDYEHEIRRIVSIKVHDVLANLSMKYDKEADIVAQDEAEYFKKEER